MKLSIASSSSNTCDTSNEGGTAIGLAIFVAILMILLAISLAVHIYCFIKYKNNYAFKNKFTTHF